MLRSRKGFTLIELLVCVFILAILFSIAVTSCGVFMSTKSLQQDSGVEIMSQEEELQQLKENQPAQPEVKSTKGNENKL